MKHEIRENGYVRILTTRDQNAILECGDDGGVTSYQVVTGLFQKDDEIFYKDILASFDCGKSATAQKPFEALANAVDALRGRRYIYLLTANVPKTSWIRAFSTVDAAKIVLKPLLEKNNEIQVAALTMGCVPLTVEKYLGGALNEYMRLLDTYKIQAIQVDAEMID